MSLSRAGGSCCGVAPLALLGDCCHHLPSFAQIPSLRLPSTIAPSSHHPHLGVAAAAAAEEPHQLPDRQLCDPHFTGRSARLLASRSFVRILTRFLLRPCAADVRLRGIISLLRLAWTAMQKSLWPGNVAKFGPRGPLCENF